MNQLILNQFIAQKTLWLREYDTRNLINPYKNIFSTIPFLISKNLKLQCQIKTLWMESIVPPGVGDSSGYLYYIYNSTIEW